MRFNSGNGLSAVLLAATVYASTACVPREMDPEDTMPAAPPANPLITPDPALLTAAAPDSFDVLFETSKGNFTIRARRDWAPNGVDRFYYLISHGYYNEARFFRAVQNFMVQFGLHAQPEITAAWQQRRIPMDSVKMGNKRGRLTYAMGSSPDTRTTQLFINFRDNDRLDAMGFAAIGEVINGMDIVDQINTEYGESPHQGSISANGNAYLTSQFPNLDYIISARVIN
jgi:peptidyl-prolyl cis-trans isomerase A (cyclophilin A)